MKDHPGKLRKPCEQIAQRILELCGIGNDELQTSDVRDFPQRARAGLWANDPLLAAHVSFVCDTGITRKADGRWHISELGTDCKTIAKLGHAEARKWIGKEL